MPACNSDVRPASFRFTTATWSRSAKRSFGWLAFTMLVGMVPIRSNSSTCSATRRLSPPYLRLSRSIAAVYAAGENPTCSIAARASPPKYWRNFSSLYSGEAGVLSTQAMNVARKASCVHLSPLNVGILARDKCRHGSASGGAEY